MKVFRFSDLLRIYDPADPYLIKIGMLLQEALEVDRIDERAFAVRLSAHLYGFLDEGQSRTRTQRGCVNVSPVVWILHRTIAEQRELLVVKIPGVVEDG